MLILFGFACLFCWILVKELPTNKSWTHWTMPLSGLTIAIDAGHGGPDGGAVSATGLIEKDVSLAVGLYLRDFLQQAGALVVMPRETDKDLADDDTKRMAMRKKEDLLRRMEYIRQKNANLLVSIHLNSFPEAKYDGAQTFFYTNHAENKRFAEAVQQELRAQLENTTRVAKYVDTVYILKSSHIPSVLVEVGFLSNQSEAERLGNAAYQRKLADAIYRGIIRFHTDRGAAQTERSGS
jgi:N-acetylmuramoyl-L-alanine amidase